MIRDWFRTGGLRREFERLRGRLVEAEELLEEAREEAVELAAERNRLREALARSREELAQREIECRKARQISAIPAASRGEVLVERARADALEARLATLQEANMAADRGW